MIGITDCCYHQVIKNSLLCLSEGCLCDRCRDPMSHIYGYNILDGCQICLEKDFSRDSEMWILYCGHVLCDTCAIRLEKCPYCQKSVSLKKYHCKNKIIQIFGRDFSGRTHSITINNNDFVRSLKEIFVGRGVCKDINILKIIYNGQYLQDHDILSDYGIISGSTVHCVAGLRGD